MKRKYHIGLMKDYRKGHEHVVILQARINKDCLDCELWHYLGVQYTTKQDLRVIAPQLLQMINTTQKTNFTKLVID